ncbi:MAG: hypothetical protein ACK5NT_05070 [Pyrinomonadaceae bacterium]
MQTCAHKELKAIDNAIQSNAPYSKIAHEFGLTPYTIRNHALNHLKPVIEKANAKAEAKIVKRVMKYREEVNYSPLDKVKCMQAKVLRDLELTENITERAVLYRAFTSLMQEENKICGNYTKDKENPESLTEAEIAKALYTEFKEKGWSEETLEKELKQAFPQVRIHEVTDSVQ